MPLLGESLALGCAFVWSVAVILFSRSLDSHAARPLRVEGVNIFKNSVAIVLLGATMLLLGTPVDWGRSAGDWALLTVSALLGLAAADCFLFASLERIGPGLLAVVELVAAPMQMLLSIVVLGERMSLPLMGAAGLVGLGLAIAVIDPASVAASKRDPARRAKGILYSVLAMAMMSIGIVMAKRPLERSDLVEVTFVRLVIGNLGLLVWIMASRRRDALSVFTSKAAWRGLLPASIVGTYISMLLWLGGFKYGDVTVVSVLNQMSTVFTIIMARVVLGETITPRRAAGSGVALLGAAALVLLQSR